MKDKRHFSQLDRFSRDQLVDMGNSLLETAEAIFARPCHVDVHCLSQNWMYGDGSSTLAGHTREAINRMNAPITTAHYTTIAALQPHDLQRGGLIQIMIRPAEDAQSAPAAAWASLRTAGKKNIAEAYIKGPEVTAETLTPVMTVWHQHFLTHQPAPTGARLPHWLNHSLKRLIKS